jgi:hypothetical protein
MVCHRIVVVFLAILSPTSGIAEFWNGNEVMEYCEPVRSFNTHGST